MLNGSQITSDTSSFRPDISEFFFLSSIEAQKASYEKIATNPEDENNPQEQRVDDPIQEEGIATGNEELQEVENTESQTAQTSLANPNSLQYALRAIPGLGFRSPTEYANLEPQANAADIPQTATDTQDAWVDPDWDYFYGEGGHVWVRLEFELDLWSSLLIGFCILDLGECVRSFFHNRKKCKCFHLKEGRGEPKGNRVYYSDLFSLYSGAKLVSMGWHFGFGIGAGYPGFHQKPCLEFERCFFSWIS
jgi:hypothetical protein